MNIFDFENRVKRAAENVQYNVDIDGLLNDLNIQKKPSSFRRLLPYFGMSSVLLLSSFLYFTYTPNINIDTKSTESVEQKSIEINKALSGAIALNQEATPTPENEIILKVSEVKSNIGNVAKLGASVEGTSIKTTSNTSTPIRATTNKSITKNHHTIISIPSQSEVATTVDQSNQETKIQLIQGLRPVTPIENNGIATNKKQATNSINKLPLITSFLEGELPKNLHKKVTDCPKFKDGNWNFAIVPEVGIVAPLKSLSLKDENFQTAYDDRIENENSQFSFQAGIGFQFKNKRTGLYFKPGISYTRVDEQYKTAESLPGQISEVRKANYQLHQFDIPVAIGSTIKLNKLSIDIEGGLKFNFLQESQGSLYESDGNFVSIDDRQPYFKESVGLGFFAGAMLKKQINPFSELYIGPRFNFNTLATSSNQNPIHQRYSFIGVHTGVIHTLF